MLFVVLIINTVESINLKTSVAQPTTLVLRLPADYSADVVWKKGRGEPVDHLVLPDGSLYISNTDWSDEGEYTVIVNGSDSIGLEALQLTVVDPELPLG